MTRRHGGVLLVNALGLLHVLVADVWTGGAGGSRAGEAEKSGRGVQGPAARWGLLRRVLEAPVESVTLRAWREGARLLRGTGV
jgi:hypothetical protein